MVILVPRAWPDTIECSAPHLQCFAGAQLFIRLLELRTALVYERAEELGGDDAALERAAAVDALELQALSEGVQVFCAMTVESAINLLGVLVLGEEQFMSKIERAATDTKLRKLMHLLREDTPPGAAPMFVAVNRLTSARNSFVHPKPQEGKYRSSVEERRGDIESARAAMVDVQIVFAGMRDLHSRCGPFFMLM